LDLIEFKKSERLFPPKGTDGRRTGVQLGKPSSVRVVLRAGFKNEKNPIFVEVNSEYYIVHPLRTKYPAIETPKEGISGTFRLDPKLKTFLDDVHKRRGRDYLLLLVHPNGVAAWRNLRLYLIDTYQKQPIDIGYEPFSREWDLILQ